ncbi:RNA polymerase sigma factor [Kitasatospora indigofera]|uniref:RNA polymerase sigma factor n=1 Tax=Kitasatospora indigofera TaxID=67307 RepID=A0A919D994_9ACTN|nr:MULTISPECIES: SigB/SigF/SigG family RNA polymerase sigma factor [Kitasatospora]MDQ0305850.1 RNA polymerase sigma-B factor [Kitasatospora herbaricolor]GHE25340.1 RNA polymerase sigma factor [Kitasatospora indigofera]
MTVQDVAPTTAPADRITREAPVAPAPVPPRAENLREVAPADARALSKNLFLRLRDLEEGTREYSYVRGTLIELNLALVKFAARRFSHRSEPMDDIIQVGTVGLIKAIDRFDPTLDYEFSTFALPTITGEIKRFFRDTSWMVHVPRRMQELRLTLAKAGDDLQQALDRAPTPREIAQHLSMDEQDVIEGLKAAEAYSTHSLDMPGDEEDAEGSIAARFAVEEKGFEAVLDLESLKPLVAALPERERAILSMRFGAEMTQSQIGERLGVSQMHVSRILNRTLSRLREALLTEQ